MNHIVRVRSKRRQELLYHMNMVIESERAERARDAWFHGALWAILRLPDDMARALADHLIERQPDRKAQIEELLK
jgi:hypothetical protein